MRERGASIITEPGFVMESWRERMFMESVLEALRGAEEALAAGEVGRALTRVRDAHGDALAVYQSMQNAAAADKSQEAPDA